MKHCKKAKAKICSNNPKVSLKNKVNIVQINRLNSWIIPCPVHIQCHWSKDLPRCKHVHSLACIFLLRYKHSKFSLASGETLILIKSQNERWHEQGAKKSYPKINLKWGKKEKLTIEKTWHSKPCFMQQLPGIISHLSGFFVTEDWLVSIGRHR